MRALFALVLCEPHQPGSHPRTPVSSHAAGSIMARLLQKRSTRRQSEPGGKGSGSGSTHVVHTELCLEPVCAKSDLSWAEFTKCGRAELSPAIAAPSLTTMPTGMLSRRLCASDGSRLCAAGDAGMWILRSLACLNIYAEFVRLSSLTPSNCTVAEWRQLSGAYEQRARRGGVSAVGPVPTAHSDSIRADG